MWHFSQRLKELFPRDVGQDQVEDDKIRFSFLDGLQRFLTGMGLVDSKALPCLEQTVQQSCVRNVVIDDQDARTLIFSESGVV